MAVGEVWKDAVTYADVAAVRAELDAVSARYGLKVPVDLLSDHDNGRIGAEFDLPADILSDLQQRGYLGLSLV